MGRMNWILFSYLHFLGFSLVLVRDKEKTTATAASFGSPQDQVFFFAFCSFFQFLFFFPCCLLFTFSFRALDVDIWLTDGLISLVADHFWELVFFWVGSAPLSHSRGALNSVHVVDAAPLVTSKQRYFGVFLCKSKTEFAKHLTLIFVPQLNKKKNRAKKIKQRFRDTCVQHVCSFFFLYFFGGTVSQNSTEKSV